MHTSVRFSAWGNAQFYVGGLPESSGDRRLLADIERQTGRFTVATSRQPKYPQFPKDISV
jgi:hypothetical protein